MVVEFPWPGLSLLDNGLVITIDERGAGIVACFEGDGTYISVESPVVLSRVTANADQSDAVYTAVPIADHRDDPDTEQDIPWWFPHDLGDGVYAARTGEHAIYFSLRHRDCLAWLTDSERWMREFCILPAIVSEPDILRIVTTPTA